MDLLLRFNGCMWILLFSCAVILLSISCQRLRSTLIKEQYACPGQVVNFTCSMTNGSFVLAWTSEEYIGCHGAQLEFTFAESVGSVMRSRTNSDTVATLVKKDERRVIESDLRILVLANFSTASIICSDVGHNDSNITFQLLTVPGQPQNVTVDKIVSVTDGDCMVLVQWMPPSIAQSSVQHYVVDSPSGSSITRNTSIRIALLVHHCDPATYIRVHAVDFCGRDGPSADNVLAQVLADEKSTSKSVQTGAGIIHHPPTAHAIILGIGIGVCFLVNIVLIIVVVICWRIRKHEQQDNQLLQPGRDLISDRPTDNVNVKVAPDNNKCVEANSENGSSQAGAKILQYKRLSDQADYNEVDKNAA